MRVIYILSLSFTICILVGCVGGYGTQYLALPYSRMTINLSPQEEFTGKEKEWLRNTMNNLKVSPEPVKQIYCPICQADEFANPSCPICASIKNLPIYARYQCPVCSGKYQGTNAVHFEYLSGHTNLVENRPIDTEQDQ